jgi:hypothetical protein
MVERRLQPPFEVATHALAIYVRGNEPMRAAESLEPPHPGGDMADLVTINMAQYGGAFAVPDELKLGHYFRRDIEPACFEHERDNGEPGEEIFRGRLGRFPEAVMSRKVPILGREVGKPRAQKLEMDRFLRCDVDPIVKEGARQRFTRKPRNHVPGEVDRVELDVCERV